jgi:hypothetical protein
MDGLVYYGECSKGRWTTASAMKAALRPEGQIAAGKVLITVVKPGSLSARVGVPEKNLFDLRIGSVAAVKPTALPGRTLKGEILAVERVAYGKGSGNRNLFGVRLKLKEGDERLIPGLTCEVEFVLWEKADALTVPNRAVGSEKGVKFVQIWKNGKTERREVVLGKTIGNKTEVVQGLQPGDEVVLPVRQK